MQPVFRGTAQLFRVLEQSSTHFSRRATAGLLSHGNTARCYLNASHTPIIPTLREIENLGMAGIVK